MLVDGLNSLERTLGAWSRGWSSAIEGHRDYSTVPASRLAFKAPTQKKETASGLDLPTVVALNFSIANFNEKTQGWRYRLFVKLRSGGKEVEVYHCRHPQAPLFPPSGLVSASKVPTIQLKSGKSQIKSGGLELNHEMESEAGTLVSARLECEFFHDLSDTSNPSRIEIRADARHDVVAS